MELDAPVERVFTFHADPRNIVHVTPSWQQVQIKEGRPEARPGDEFEIVVRFCGWLPLRWRGIWREVSDPTLLVDEAITSPFAYWRHEHHFEPMEHGRTRMTDHVRYLFPGGWVGKWFGETLGRVQFHLMFTGRHARTRRWMREAS